MTNQQRAFDKLSKLKVGALFMEMGTGKTKVALDLIASKIHKVDYVLWICPCSLKNEIEAERLKWHPDIALDVVGCESIGSSDRIYLETLQKVQNHKSFIVVDESLKIKNVRAKRTRRIIILGDHAQYKLILNGTPVSKNIMDIWAQMEFLSPKILGMSYLEFKDTYCEYYLKGKLKGKIRQQCNIPHLISKIEPYIFDCELDIDTKKVYEIYYYCLHDHEEYVAYRDEAFEEYYDPVRDDINFNAFAMALQRWYCNAEHSDKNQVMQRLLRDIDDKTIVFVRYLSSIPKDAISITGYDSDQQRAEKIAAFKQGVFDVLYITYGCGAYGLNLQFCKNIIFAEHTWDYAQRVQAEARIYRMGQGEQVNYYDLICEGVGLEDLITQCIVRKSSLLNTIKTEISKTKGGIKEWVKSI